MVTHSESALVRRDLLANVSRDRFHRAREYKPHLRDGSMGQSHTAAINACRQGMDSGVTGEGAAIKKHKRAGKIESERGKQGERSEASEKAGY